MSEISNKQCFSPDRVINGLGKHNSNCNKSEDKTIQKIHEASEKTDSLGECRSSINKIKGYLSTDNSKKVKEAAAVALVKVTKAVVEHMGKITPGNHSESDVNNLEEIQKTIKEISSSGAISSSPQAATFISKAEEKITKKIIELKASDKSNSLERKNDSFIKADNKIEKILKTMEGNSTSNDCPNSLKYLGKSLIASG